MSRIAGGGAQWTSLSRTGRWRCREGEANVRKPRIVRGARVRLG